MHILMTGGTGFIGSALVEFWRKAGHRLTILTRQSLAEREGIRYISSLSQLSDQEVFDAGVNLAGYSLFDRPWIPPIKRKITTSRIETTQSLVALNARLETPFPVVVSGSAVGIYGNHSHHWLTETATVGMHFGARLCQQWEQEAAKMEARGTRVCCIRTGIVLGDGGALKPLKMAARFGVLNVLGSGDQYWPWIDLADEVRAIDFLINHPQISGAFNLSAPTPVTNREFTEALAKVMHRKILLPSVPGVLLKTVTLGAGELLLDSQRVTPSQLLGAGFEFEVDDLEKSLARYC